MMRLRYSKYWHTGTDEEVMALRDAKAAQLREQYGVKVETFTSDEFIEIITLNDRSTGVWTKVYNLQVVEGESNE